MPRAVLKYQQYLQMGTNTNHNPKYMSNSVISFMCPVTLGSAQRKTRRVVDCTPKTVYLPTQKRQCFWCKPFKQSWLCQKRQLCEKRVGWSPSGAWCTRVARRIECTASIGQRSTGEHLRDLTKKRRAGVDIRLVANRRQMPKRQRKTSRRCNSKLDIGISSSRVRVLSRSTFVLRRFTFA